MEKLLTLRRRSYPEFIANRKKCSPNICTIRSSDTPAKRKEPEGWLTLSASAVRIQELSTNFILQIASCWSQCSAPRSELWNMDETTEPQSYSVFQVTMPEILTRKCYKSHWSGFTTFVARMPLRHESIHKKETQVAKSDWDLRVVVKTHEADFRFPSMPVSCVLELHRGFWDLFVLSAKANGVIILELCATFFCRIFFLSATSSILCQWAVTFWLTCDLGGAREQFARQLVTIASVRHERPASQFYPSSLSASAQRSASFTTNDGE